LGEEITHVSFTIIIITRKYKVNEFMPEAIKGYVLYLLSIESCG